MEVMDDEADALRPGFRRASASIPSEKSTAVTSAPEAANQREWRPVPQPRSSTASPETSPTSSRMCGPSRASKGFASWS